MRQELFSVYDSAARAFLPPFCAETVEVAIRRFRATVNHPDSDMRRFPEDYTLFHVGSFLQESGMMVALEGPHSLGVALTYLESPYDNGSPQVKVVNDG